MTNQYSDYDKLLDELRNMDQVYANFMKDGQYSVDVSKKLKRNMGKVFIRNNRTLKLKHRSRRSLFSKYVYFGYVFWVDIIVHIFTPKDKGYRVVRFFSMAFWEYIKTFHGEDIDDKTMRVTFYART